MILGVILRVWQFAFNRSLWLDEAGLALSILGRSGARLFGVLDYGQMAPSGFLMLEKCLTLALGGREWVFRLWPLTAGLGALVVVAVLARRILPPMAGVMITALFAVNHRLIYYASETKQYSGDVLAAALLLLLVLRALRGPLTWRAALGLGTVGAVAGWLSHPSLFVSAGGGAALMLCYGRQRDRQSLQRLGATFVMWGLCLVPVLLINLHSVGDAADREYMMRSWIWGFPPEHLWRRATIAWLALMPLDLIAYLFDAGPWVAGVILALCVVGALVAKGKTRGVRALLVLPLAAGFAASVFRLLPLSERVGLWVTPFVVILIGFGIAQLMVVGRPLLRLAGVVIGVALIGLTGTATLKAFPKGREELRPVLEAVAGRLENGDEVYVYYGAVPAFRYYSSYFPELTTASREGRCARNQWPRYLEEIVPLGREAKTWVVFSHQQVEQSEGDFILQALDQLGSRADAIEATGAAAYLYAFPIRSAEQVAAVTRTVPSGRNRSEPDWICRGGPLSARNWPAEVPRVSP